ncbi:MAG TPA: Uma2 family endonuclease [Acetobacteraceae bacterium]
MTSRTGTALRHGGPALGTGRWRAGRHGASRAQSRCHPEPGGDAARPAPAHPPPRLPRDHHARCHPQLRARFNERIPDLGVSCGSFTDGRALPDPVLLVEILSPSNEAKTRVNAWAYATIQSVQEVLILSSTAVRAEILRQGEETPEIVVGTETLRLASIGYAGPLADFYATTDLT